MGSALEKKKKDRCAPFIMLSKKTPLITFSGFRVDGKKIESKCIKEKMWFEV